MSYLDDDIQQELERLIQRELPRAERDAADLARVKQINAAMRQEERHE